MTTDSASSIFSEEEIEYLRSQHLARIATSSPDGIPDVTPVGFNFDGKYFYIGGMNITKTTKYKNVMKNNNVALVVDDLKTINPWNPRGLRIYGTAEIVARENIAAGQLRDNSHFKPMYIKIKPIKKWSWGIDRAVFQEGRFIVSKKTAT